MNLRKQAFCIFALLFGGLLLGCPQDDYQRHQDWCEGATQGGEDHFDDQRCN